MKHVYTVIVLAITLGFVSIAVNTMPLYAQTNQTNTSEVANNSTDIVTGNTFSADGAITSLIFDRESSESKAEILGGNWTLDVKNDTVNEFRANIMAVKIDGTDMQSITIHNFRLNNQTSEGLQLQRDGATNLTGMSDIEMNNESLTDVQTEVVIEKLNTISITVDPNATDNRFKDQPLYGVVYSFKDDKGQDLLADALQGVQSAEDTLAQMGENLTESTEQLGNQTGQAFESALNTTGNMVEEVGQVIENIFNGSNTN